MDKLLLEIKKFGKEPNNLEQIREKDGISLYRVRYGSDTYVLKYFDNDQGPAEPQYYRLLKGAGVATPAVVGLTDNSILMEDLASSLRWRLGTEQDMNDPVVAQNLARWYKAFHDTSEQILSQRDHWYSEYGLLTVENLRNAALKTQSASEPVWELVVEHLDYLMEMIRKLHPVVNYNDFYYTNLAVGRNGLEAMMFDYNCMGKGYRAADIRNVCASLGMKAAAAFRESYGPIDEYEFVADDVISALTTLVMAAKYDVMPWWAEESIRTVKSGQLECQFREFVGI